MAITLINSTATFETNHWASNDLVGTEPTSATTNDVLVAFCTTRAGTATLGAPSGWTEIDAPDIGGCQVLAAYIVRGGSAPDYNFTSDFGTSSGVDAAVVIGCFRGVDTTTPLDVTYVQATHLLDVGADISPDPKAITTVTDDAWVLVGACLRTGSSWTDTTKTPSTNYTEMTHYDQAGPSVMVFVQYREITTAGVEDPDEMVWSATGPTDNGVFTIALRPDTGGGGPSIPILQNYYRQQD